MEETRQKIKRKRIRGRPFQILINVTESSDFIQIYIEAARINKIDHYSLALARSPSQTEKKNMIHINGFVKSFHDRVVRRPTVGVQN